RLVNPDPSPEGTDTRSAQQKIDDILGDASAKQLHHLLQEELCLILGKPTSHDGIADMEDALGDGFDLDGKAIIYNKAWAVTNSTMIGKPSKDIHELPSQLNYREAEMAIRYCKGPGSQSQFEEALIRYINRRKPLGTEWTKGDFHHLVDRLEKKALERFGSPPRMTTDDEYTMRLLFTFLKLREQSSDEGSTSNIDTLLFRGTFYGSEQIVYDAFREAGNKLASDYAALKECCQRPEDQRPLQILFLSMEEDAEPDIDAQLSRIFG
ncbi:MAG: hypothetical protein Q9183_003260, partial [Haloplaca sp. 2 TL-2023]